MKTITSFLISVLLTILSGYVLALAIHSIQLSNYTFTNNQLTGVFDFQFTFLFCALAQVVVSLFILSNAIKVFNISIDFYTKYQIGKRERDILKDIEQAKYHKLYTDLNATNSVDKKEEVYNTFKNHGTVEVACDAGEVVDIYNESLGLSKEVQAVKDFNFEAPNYDLLNFRRKTVKV
jgi:hypothetical protein